MLETSPSRVQEPVQIDGTLYVARPGYNLPEPQVTKEGIVTMQTLLFQGPGDLLIYPEEIKDNKFRTSLYGDQHHPYEFRTPDCPFLKLELVSPYEVDCQDLENLTICTRSTQNIAENGRSMFLDLRFSVNNIYEGKHSCSLQVEDLTFAEQFGVTSQVTMFYNALFFFIKGFSSESFKVGFQ